MLNFDRSTPRRGYPDRARALELLGLAEDHIPHALDVWRTLIKEFPGVDKVGGRSGETWREDVGQVQFEIQEFLTSRNLCSDAVTAFKAVKCIGAFLGEQTGRPLTSHYAFLADSIEG